MEEYQALKFAALFHDIGKFYQRADNLGKGKQSYDSRYNNLAKDIGPAHPKWSADFVKDYFDDLVEDLVLYHHKPLNAGNVDLAKIVQKADHHSSKERIESDEKQDVLLTPLTSIFSRISLNDKKSEKYYVPVTELDFNKVLHPQDQKVSNGWNLVPDYEYLWANFVNEFKMLVNKDFESVLAILKKYTSTIPSAVYVSESDISLYDHLKTTAAIANCRYLFSKEENLTQTNTQEVYRIINGDISGIQKFIYKVSSPDEAQSGMSKRLRGRSLYLTLLTEAIAHKIILDLNLDSSNILFCGGGRFTIIAPNTKKTDKVLKEIDLSVNDYFIKHFNAELYLALVSVETNGDGLGEFGEILSKLNALLNENKKHKFINHLSDLFKISDDASYELCPVCGNPSKKDELCFDCREHEKLGGIVANAKYLIKYNSDKKLEKSLYFENLNIGFIFKNTKKQVIDVVNKTADVKFIVYKLNNTHFLDLVNDVSNENVSFDFKVLGNSIPNIAGKPLYFNHLAEISKGASKLGILKMDVDNLGKIFSQGFHNLGDENQGASISRISSLSFYMDLFFSGKINQIVDKFKVYTDTLGHDDLFTKRELTFDNGKTEKVYKPIDTLPDKFKDLGTSTIHINYSGGDDLLVVGPYDDIIEFAQEFRNQFKKWTAFNNSINISGGIVITGPKFPIGKAALMADDELEKSKDCGRDKITLFNQVLSWESNIDRFKGFDELFEFGKYLEELYPKYISKGFIYSLLQIWQSRSDVEELSKFNEKDWMNKNVEKLSKKRYVPLFMYKLRLIKNREIRDDLAKKGIKYMPWIKTPVSWASLRLR